jgi:hypothetical protein
MNAVERRGIRWVAPGKPLCRARRHNHEMMTIRIKHILSEFAARVCRRLPIGYQHKACRGDIVVSQNGAISMGG